MAYDAFISYSHGADLALAKVMRDGLQKLAKPWNRRRALDIFLDQSSLELSSELGSSLDKRIDDTEWLVLLMSETSAQSKWVGAEIKEWADAKSKDRMALVLTSGEIVWDDDANDFDYERSTAINEGMRGVFSGQESEPLYLDMRWTKDVAEGEEGLDLDHVRFRDAIATVAASIHGKSKDEIEGEDIRQHRRTVRIRRIAVAALAVLTLAAVAAGIVALIQRQQAIEEANRAESRALASDALNNAETETDLAALLALESVRIANTADARGSLAEVLSLPTRFLQRTDAHAAPVTAITFSDDGRLAATGDDTGVIRVWDVDEDPSATPQATVRDVELELESAVIELFLSTEDGETVIAFDESGAIISLDVATGATTTIPAPDEFISIAVSPNDTVLAGFRPDGLLLVYRLDEETGEFIGLAEQQFETDDVENLTFSPDGSVLGLSSGPVVGVWSWMEEDEVWFDELVSAVTSIAFSPTTETSRPVVAVGQERGNIFLYDRANPELRDDLDPSLFTEPADLAFKPTADEDGTYTLASAHTDGEVILWGIIPSEEESPPFGFEIDSMSGHRDEALQVAFAPDGRIASADFEGEVIWWLDTPVSSLGVDRRTTDAGEVAIGDAVFVEGIGIVARDQVGNAWIWRSGESEADALRQDDDLTAIDATSEVIALGLVDGTTMLVDPDGDEAGALGPLGGPVSLVAVSGDSAGVVTLSEEADEVKVWDRSSGSVLSEPQLPEGFLPTSVLLAGDAVWLGGKMPDDLPVVVKYDAATGAELGRIPHSQREGNAVTALTVSADGDTLATGAQDRKISLWDTGTLESKVNTEFSGHRGVVTGIVYWDDGETLISSDDAGAVIMWDLSEQRPFAGFGGPERAVLSLEVDDDSQTLLGASDDGAVWTWTLDPDQWRERACLLAGRNLTSAEWDLYGDGGRLVRHCEMFSTEESDARDANYGEALTD